MSITDVKPDEMLPSEAAVGIMQLQRRLTELRSAAAMVVGLALAFAFGALCIAAAYSRAARSATDTSHFGLFWLGVLVFMLPAACLIVARVTTRAARVATLVAISAFLFLPKFLLDPNQPRYHDELAHWRQVVDISRTGRLGVPSALIAIIGDFPGLHIVTLLVQRATGMSIWHAGLTVVVLAHTLALIAVFLLVEGITGSDRAGAVGALLYALNSSYMYFHTQFAYESLSIAFFLVAILTLQRVEAARTRAEQRAWLTVSIVVGAGTVATHHLATLALGIVLVAWAVVTWIRSVRRAEPDALARVSLIAALAIVGIAVFWVTVIAPGTVAYLRPYPQAAVHQLLAHLHGGHSTSRTLFAKSGLPWWERGAAFLADFVALGGMIAAVFYWARGRMRTSLLFVLALVAVGYFVSVPFILSPSGAEGARRSWGYSYVALALFAAPLVCLAIDALPRLAPRIAGAVAVGLTALFVVMLVGNVASGLNSDYRFPGPYVYGSDTRSLSPELLSLTQWVHDTAGRGQRIVADRDTSLALAAFGDERVAAPSTGFATYDLWFHDSYPTAFLLSELSTSFYSYLIIDKRAAYETPAVGVYFSPDEPYTFASDAHPISTASLEKFASYPWCARVYESDNYVVYRLQFDSLLKPVARQHP